MAALPNALANAMASSLIFSDNTSFIADLAVLYCVSFLFFVWLLKPSNDADDADDEKPIEAALRRAWRRGRREQLRRSQREQPHRAASKPGWGPESSVSDSPPAAPTTKPGRDTERKKKTGGLGGEPGDAETAARGRARRADQGAWQQRSATNLCAPSLPDPEQHQRQESTKQERAGAALEQTRGDDLMGSDAGRAWRAKGSRVTQSAFELYADGKQRGRSRTVTGTRDQHPTTNWNSNPNMLARVPNRPARVQSKSREVEKTHSSGSLFYSNIVQKALLSPERPQSSAGDLQGPPLLTL